MRSGICEQTAKQKYPCLKREAVEECSGIGENEPVHTPNLTLLTAVLIAGRHPACGERVLGRPSIRTRADSEAWPQGGYVSTS